MRNTLTLLLLSLAVGCSSRIGRLDRALFDIRTNYVPEVHIFTNTVRVPVEVQVTNDVVRFVTNTPAPGVTLVTTNLTQIITNQIVIVQTNVVAKETNLVEHIGFTPKQTVSDSISAAVGTATAPIGWGGFASTAAVGLLGLLARQRERAVNKQKTRVNEVFAQSIEVGRELLKGTPQGVAAEAKYRRWLAKHQKEAGIIDAAANVVATTVDNDEAKEVAEMLKPSAPTATTRTA